MHIAYIELQNVKSYEKSGRIEFAKGINAISGQNGAGKSTILEAIGFALFDSRIHTSRNFIREGCRNGEVVVGFVDTMDDRVYEVVRSINPTPGNPYIFDPETKVKLAVGKDDVYSWIKDHLKVSQTSDLIALFEDAVGVQQGLLTASFQLTPSLRKIKFDRLLQVDEYDNVHKWLADSEKCLKDLISDERVRFEGLKTRLDALPELNERIWNYKKQVEEGNVKLGGINTELDKAQNAKAKLDSLKTQINQLENAIKLAQSEASNLETRYQTAEVERQEAARAKTQMDESEGAYQGYQECEALRLQLDLDRNQRDEQNRQLNEKQTKILLAEANLEKASNDLLQVAEADKKKAEFEPVVLEFRRLNKELNNFNTSVVNRDVALTRGIEENNRQARMREELQQVQQQLVRRAAIDQEIAVIELALNNLNEELTLKKANITRCEEMIPQITERREILMNSAEGECPVCQSQLSEEKRQELNEQYEAEINELNEQIRLAGARQKGIEGEQKQFRHNQRDLKKELEHLAAPSREFELQGQISNQEAEIEKWNKELATYEGLDERISQLKKTIAEVGNPESEYAVVEALTLKRSGVEKSIRELTESIRTLKEQQSKSSELLASFAGLDEKISGVLQKLEILKPGYNTYISNSYTAKKLSEREKKVGDLKTSKEKATGAAQKLVDQLSQISPSYDLTEHNLLIESVSQLNRQQAALEANITSLKRQLSEAQERAKNLLPLERQKEASEKELATLRAVSEALTFLRKTIRDAGPHIVKQLLQAISDEADHIYGEVLNDHTARLKWLEDYEIQLEQSGYTRDFSQLSGGEKMATALAVRLALLQEMSEIRIAFFDEPTAHLDDDRRDNLAEQITKIEGFEQLFVISHDDTFERQTDLVLHVSKANGASKIENMVIHA